MLNRNESRPKRILLIVEGKKSEPSVLGSALERYGFHTILSNQPLNVEDIGQFERFDYSLNKVNIVIVQGPKNRIHDLLLYFRESEMSLERAFLFPYASFSGIFLIYDVDHNSAEDIEEMYARFRDESSGMLLLSSPCFEVIADFDQNRQESRFAHLSEYKALLNKHYEGNTYNFMKENFSTLLLHYLDKNKEDFDELNIMEHPRLIIDYINRENLRVNCPNRADSYVVYRYFSTVIYVAIAYANGLTREVDNYASVREFLLKSGSIG